MSRKPGRKRRTQIDGQFAARTIKMLESPPFRVLRLSAHRVLARLEVELAHHGGMDNGRLPVTYDDYQQYGIDRHAIAPAIRELTALGFIEVTEHGCAGNAEWRTPNRFRLTYKPTKDANPTDDWKWIQTIDQAMAKAQAARTPVTKPRRAIKNKKPVGEKTADGVGNPHLGSVQGTATTGKGAKPTLLSIFRGGELGVGTLPKPIPARPRITSGLDQPIKQELPQQGTIKQETPPQGRNPSVSAIQTDTLPEDDQ